MCEQPNQLILCSCAPTSPTVHNKNSRRAKKQPAAAENIVWVLSRYLGEHEISMEGLMMEPSYQLGQGLTAEFILQQLNSRNCFDFGYEPQELDQLSIHQPSMGRIILLYRQATWRVDSHGWGAITETIGKGTVKVG